MLANLHSCDLIQNSGIAIDYVVNCMGFQLTTFYMYTCHEKLSRQSWHLLLQLTEVSHHVNYQTYELHSKILSQGRATTKDIHKFEGTMNIAEDI